MQLQLKRNGVQIDAKGFKNLLMIMVLEIYFFEKMHFKIHFSFSFLFTCESAKQVPAWMTYGI